MEHEDPDTEYEVKIPYGSYIEFSKYVKEVQAAGFDIPEVMTIFKKIENPRGQGGLFTFEMEISLTKRVVQEKKLKRLNLLPKNRKLLTNS